MDGPVFGPAHQANNRREDRIVATKLFVGNLAFSTTQTELSELFGEHGEINEVFIPTDRDSGRPRGFAFVEFTDEGAATAAIEKLDGYELGGRNLRVNAAEERSRTPRVRSGPNEGGGGYDAPKRSKPKGSRKNARARKRGG
jgi:cold-inducible RNA-binding protein